MDNSEVSPVPWKRKEVIGNATLKWVVIYALCGPDDVPRYIGKTTQRVGQRFKAHCRAARNPRLPVHWWMRKMLDAGAPFTIIHLEQVPPMGNWQFRESHWIEKYRESGVLLNLTNGGEGLDGHRFSQEHRDKIAAALRTGAMFNCEVCAAPFWRKQFAIKRGDNRFCSRACYFVWQRGKTKRMPKHDRAS